MNDNTMIKKQHLNILHVEILEINKISKIKSIIIIYM